MSNGDRHEAQRGHETPACGTDDLKSLLQTIAEQIADSDRRQGEALTLMKDRLGTLGDEARSIRMRVPAEFAPAFERIEEGMALLADRIAGVSPGRRSQPWAIFQSAGMSPAPLLVPAEPAPASAAQAADAPRTAPLALRSAAGPDGAQARAAAPVDPFDFIDSTTRSTSGEWDAADADALTRLYESGEAGLPPRARSKAAPELNPAAAPGEGAVEREWLEDRLTEVAQRLERSIKDARADSSITALGQRLDRFERHFDDAMRSVAMHADVEGLHLVEAHIGELAMHVEQAERQLQRLDIIEGHLEAMVDKLSDQRYASLLQQAMPDLDRIASAAAEQAALRLAELRPAHADSDIERLADLAAGRAAVQVAGISGARGGDEHRLEDLRGLLEGFIIERRQGDEQTASMLDTMQQAMIRVLDRIDAIEMAQTRAPLPVAPPFQSSAQPVAAAELPAPRLAAEPEPLRSSAPLDAAMVPRVPPYGGISADSAPLERDPGPALEPEPRALQPRSKEDFIAAARRAARQAANEPPAPVSPGAPPRGKAADPASVEKKSIKSLFSLGLGRKSALASSMIAIAVMTAALLVYRNDAVAPVLSKAWLPVEAGVAAAAPAAPALEPARLLNPGEADRDVTSSAAVGTPDSDAEAPEHAGAQHADEMQEPAELVPAPAPPARRGANTAALPGVTLQASSSAPTLRDLNRLREQQDMATLSSRLGAEAVKSTPASLLVEQQLHAPAQADTPTSAAVPREAAPAVQRAVALPPASVGPSSLRVAAAKGDASAEFEVGARLAEGKGTDQSFVEAIQWYQRSAQKGFAQAQYRLGTFYERGLGTKPDLARAAVWYKRAAEQGNVKAMHNLAVLSASRKAGAPDYDTAAKWFADAADRGLADSQFNLAVLYESGLGVPKDLRQAYKWLTLAARAGDAETVKRRERMRKELTRADLEAAEAMIRDWQPVATDALANDPRVAGEAWKKRAGAASDPNG